MITRAHAQENEGNQKLFKREWGVNESGIKASDCQYFLAFKLTSNDNLLHKLKEVQDECLAQDSSLHPMLEPLEKAHILLNIIRCDETRLEELKKLIGEVVDKHRDDLANPPEIEVRGLGIERLNLSNLYQPISLYAKFYNTNFNPKIFDERNDFWFSYIYDLFEKILHENGFVTLDHCTSEELTLFRAKAGHEFKVKRRALRPYSREVFGTLSMKDLSTLHLCSMKSTTPTSEDGFYHIEDVYSIV